MTFVVAVFTNQLVLHDPEVCRSGECAATALLFEGRAARLSSVPTGWAGTSSAGSCLAPDLLSIAAMALAFGGIVGVVLGMIAGYRGGLIDVVIMRLADSFLAFPSVLIALVLAVPRSGRGWNSLRSSWGFGALGAVREAHPRRSADLEGAGLRGTRAGFRRDRALHRVPPPAAQCGQQPGGPGDAAGGLGYRGRGIPDLPGRWCAAADTDMGRHGLRRLDFIESAWWISSCRGWRFWWWCSRFNVLGDWLRDKLDPQLRSV